MTEDELRERLLMATLQQVPFEGWNEAALRAGAESIGLCAGDAALAFPGGATEMIAFWSEYADHLAMVELQAVLPSLPELQQRICEAVRLRIQQHEIDREAVRRTLSFLALPNHAALAARTLYRTVDSIWYGCGDTSVDMSFYTKRASLAATYTATVLYWLDDESEERVETWAFLERRLGDLAVLPRLRRRVQNAAPFSSTEPSLFGVPLPSVRFPSLRTAFSRCWPVGKAAR